jgi:putative thioredoxin
MTLDIGAAPNAGPAPGSASVKESSTAQFAADVIEASRVHPVIVDFWAPWCGPCRQLTPILERLVAEANGAMTLVKINVDENQPLAGQMGVQSIPAVVAFIDGRPADGFMGALPESEVRAFLDRLPRPANAADPLADPLAGTGADAAPSLDSVLDQADAALVETDLARAAQIYGQVAQIDPENARALIGLARIHIAAGNLDQARKVFALIRTEDTGITGYDVLQKTLEMAEQASGLGASDELVRLVNKNPDDHQARFDLALALNQEGDRIAAAGQLIEIIRADRTWKEQAARLKLLELFQVWGPSDEATLKGRRQLSSLLFS